MREDLCVTHATWADNFYLISSQPSTLQIMVDELSLEFFALRVTPPAQHRKVPMEALKKNSFKKVPKLQATWDPNRDQKRSKWSPKTTKMDAQTLQNRAQIGPRGGQDDKKTEK